MFCPAQCYVTILTDLETFCKVDVSVQCYFEWPYKFLTAPLFLYLFVFINKLKSLC